ncbi:hypothetical protein [Treponema putidum]|nr:hypothetical protein [Treponema putidum]
MSTIRKMPIGVQSFDEARKAKDMNFYLTVALQTFSDIVFFSIL